MPNISEPTYEQSATEPGAVTMRWKVNVAIDLDVSELGEAFRVAGVEANRDQIANVAEAIMPRSLRTRGGESPVHKSHFSRKDKEDIFSVRIKPVDKTKGTFTHHVYSDGTGTFKKGDRRGYSSVAERRE
ncbi:hypothetical protein B0J12DRAFT_740934 [Macrophomina phaseolina]|uniref:Uncharacterized protein n=1 Tax=Macrophomina phaseolina TaxID=35725 RepID=A0ABQ8GAA2_9PEZI|nr:hypothetical protein B0J12DRAFT_740934 [Macrophomina phaseolina]